MDIGIERNRIAVIATDGLLPPARREIDATGLLVLPGAIDIHFHVRAPGHPERGTFVTESQAAAAGGVTTFLEMPISVPCCARPEVFESRKQLGLAESYVNFGLYGAPGLLDRDGILRMGEAGACGFKIFTHAIQPGREDEFIGLCLPDEGDVFTALEHIKETGLLTSFHAENERLIQRFERLTRGTGRLDPRAFAESRPPVVEAMSIAQIAVMCGAVGTRVHIAHVSGAQPLRELQAAQARGLPMTGETCPTYLARTVADLERLGPYALIKPPLREPADQQALWRGLRDGALAAITTDHSPFTLAEKERGIDDIWKAAIGVPGIEALVPFVMTEALESRITLQQAVNWLAHSPARLFGLMPHKGAITVGADADLLLYDPRPSGPLDCTTWHTKAKAISRLFHGLPTRGRVHTTIVNGTVVYTGGRIVAERPGGQFVRPLAR
jgi:dihydroorotase (multifunctional complex type)